MKVEILLKSGKNQKFYMKAWVISIVTGEII